MPVPKVGNHAAHFRGPDLGMRIGARLRDLIRIVFFPIVVPMLVRTHGVDGVRKLRLKKKLVETGHSSTSKVRLRESYAV